MVTRISMLFTLSALGCADQLVDPEGEHDGGERYAEGSPEAELILLAANELSFEELDEEVPLDSRAADNIVYVRSGPDEIDDTDDDTPITSLIELDAIPYVTETAMEAMLDYATERWGQEELDCPEGFIVSSDGKTMFSDLRSATQQAQDGTTLELCAGTFRTNGIAPNSITLRGRGVGITTIDTSASSSNSIYVGSLSALRTLTVEGLSFVGDGDGNVSPIRIVGGGALVVRDSEFIDNAASYGGAIVVEWGGALTAERTRFVGNHAVNRGGAIYVDGNGSATLIDSDVLQNTAYLGGGITLNDQATLETTNVDFGWRETDNSVGDVYLGRNGTTLHYRAGTDIVCTPDTGCL